MAAAFELLNAERMIEVVNTLKFPIRAAHSRGSFPSRRRTFSEPEPGRTRARQWAIPTVRDNCQQPCSWRRIRRHSSTNLLQDTELPISRTLNQRLMFLNDLPEDVAWLLLHFRDGHVDSSFWRNLDAWLERYSVELAWRGHEISESKDSEIGSLSP